MLSFFATEKSEIQINVAKFAKAKFSYCNFKHFAKFYSCIQYLSMSV